MRWFGLLGYPLSHSFSQKYFTEKFQREGIEAEYHLWESKEILLFNTILQLNPQIEGFNVTIPHKQAIIKYLGELDDTARAVGAVNTVKVINQQPMHGYNTDVHGFRQSIKPFLEMHHERALVLGTGGSSKAVEYVLRQIGIDCYFVSRDPGRKEKHFSYEEVNRYVIESFPLIINTTPLGMYPGIEVFPPIPYEYITPRHLLYDLIYNPAETQFLQKGKAQGAITINGLSMLYAQADKAWEIWNTK
jgi:shikimate dehydrogenase